MASKTVTPPAPAAAQLPNADRALSMLEEIVQAANRADLFAADHPVGSDRDCLQNHVDFLRNELCRIGWIAERALVNLGAGDVLAREGKAENWLMAPACREQWKARP